MAGRRILGSRWLQTASREAVDVGSRAKERDRKAVEIGWCCCQHCRLGRLHTGVGGRG